MTFRYERWIVEWISIFIRFRIKLNHSSTEQSFNISSSLSSETFSSHSKWIFLHWRPDRCHTGSLHNGLLCRNNILIKKKSLPRNEIWNIKDGSEHQLTRMSEGWGGFYFLFLSSSFQQIPLITIKQPKCLHLSNISDFSSPFVTTQDVNI